MSDKSDLTTARLHAQVQASTAEQGAAAKVLQTPYVPRSPDDMKVGMGLPGEPKELLTAREEKSLDDKGRLVVHKEPWSYVPTDLYLTVWVSEERGAGVVKCERPMTGGSILLGFGHVMMITGTQGKPAFDQNGWGVSLELPSDLASDPLKKSYVTEWVIDAVKSLMVQVGAVVPKGSGEQFAFELTAHCDAAIRGTGL